MSATKRPIRAVLFDKDGTLIDFHASWTHAGQIAARELCAIARQPQLYDQLLCDAGYDAARGQLDPHSLWAAGTTEALICHWIAQLGLANGSVAVTGDSGAGPESANSLVLRMTALMNTEAGRRIVPLADLRTVFTQLRGLDLQLGVATMDVEASAHSAVDTLGVNALVDFVCGCDSGHGVKPGPGMVLAFCQRCGLDPHEVMVVGDTPHDMNMARAAGAGAAVAVVTGAGTAQVLAELADHVLDDLDALVALLTSGVLRPSHGGP